MREVAEVSLWRSATSSRRSYHLKVFRETPRQPRWVLRSNALTSLCTPVGVLKPRFIETTAR